MTRLLIIDLSDVARKILSAIFTLHDINMSEGDLIRRALLINTGLTELSPKSIAVNNFQYNMDVLRVEIMLMSLCAELDKVKENYYPHGNKDTVYWFYDKANSPNHYYGSVAIAEVPVSSCTRDIVNYYTN